jgi:mono/diheme cytochrome c family protein
MKARYALAFLLASLIALSGCDQGARMSSKGFRLPDGDAQAGREAFLYMQCHQCHTIEGMELPEMVKTYGELITAIINPSHKLARGYADEVVAQDGESKMYIYNEHMTVQELIDIVMFLQPQYEVVPPEYHYRVYPAT